MIIVIKENLILIKYLQKNNKIILKLLKCFPSEIRRKQGYSLLLFLLNTVLRILVGAIGEKKNRK